MPMTPAASTRYATPRLIVALACLWLYVQKSLFSVAFSGGTVLNQTSAALAGSAAVLISVCAAVVLAPRMRPRGQHTVSRYIALIGLGGGVCTAGALALNSSWGPANPAATAVAATLLVLQGTAFTVVFLAWGARILMLAREHGPIKPIVDVLIAMVIALFMGSNSLNGTLASDIMDVLGLPLAACCYPGLALNSRPTPACAQSPISAAGWLKALVFCFLLFATLMVQASPFAPSFANTTDEAVSYLLPIIVVLIVIVAVQYADRTGHAERALLTFMGLWVALSLLVACVTVFVLSTQGDYQHELIRFARRATRPLAFVLILSLTYRLGLSAAKGFGVLFLGPIFLGKFLQMLALRALPYWWPQFDSSDYLLGLSLASGFAMALCLAASGWVLARDRVASSANPSPNARDADPALQRACDRLTARYRLSQREADVLVCIARGLSARAIANELTISEGTVNTHSASLYRKLTVHTRIEVAALVDEEMTSSLISI